MVTGVEGDGDPRLTLREPLLALGEGLPPGVPRADARSDGTRNEGEEGELDGVGVHDLPPAISRSGTKIGNCSAFFPKASSIFTFQSSQLVDTRAKSVPL